MARRALSRPPIFTTGGAKATPSGTWRRSIVSRLHPEWLGRNTASFSGADVSADFFPLLGARIELGRLPAEETRAQPRRDPHLCHLAAILGGRAIWGQALTLNGTVYTVAGVLPRTLFCQQGADYHARNQFDLFRPIALPAPPPEWCAERILSRARPA